MINRSHNLGALLTLGPSALRRYRNIDWRRVDRLHFVCKGNICRSVYAEYRAEKIGVPATSSGLQAAIDDLANPSAQRIAATRGINLEPHKTQRFEQVELLPGDLVVAMEPWQARVISAHVAAAQAQVTLLGLWAADVQPLVPDPFGGDEAVFARCFEFIDRAVNGIVYRMRAAFPTGPLQSLRSGRSATKSLVGRVLYRSQLYRLLLRRRAVVVAFHSIVADGPGDALRTPLTAFDAYCRFFARYFVVVSLHELVQRLKQGKPIDRLLAVTFDDGYEDNARLAAPVLNRYGIPATFFVTGGFINTDVQAPWDARKSLRSEWMSWQQVTNLAAEGHAIEVHTMSHQEISAIDTSTLDNELRNCATLIQQHTGHQPELFAVPFGRASSLTPSVLERIAAHGFSATVTASGGAITPNSSTRRLNRFPMNFTDAISPTEIGFDILRDCLSVDRASTVAQPS